MVTGRVNTVQHCGPEEANRICCGWCPCVFLSVSRVLVVVSELWLLKMSVSCEPQYRLLVQCLLESEVVSGA